MVISFSTLAAIATYGAPSRAQTASGVTPTGATGPIRSGSDKRALVHNSALGKSKTRIRRPATSNYPMSDLQLILPDPPTCWSHSRAENPQGSQDNGGPFLHEPRDSAHSRASSDPLLGPGLQNRLASPMPSSRSSVHNADPTHKRLNDPAIVPSDAPVR